MSLEEALLIKKDLSKMRDKYEPKWVEAYWYQEWLDKKYFTPDAAKAANTPLEKKFIMLVPPPSKPSNQRCHWQSAYRPRIDLLHPGLPRQIVSLS